MDPLIHKVLTLSVIFNQSVQNPQEQFVIAKSSARPRALRCSKPIETALSSGQ